MPAQKQPVLYGLNGQVTAITTFKDKAYLGGYFSATNDGSLSLKNIAIFDRESGELAPLRCGNTNGVNGQVTVFADFQGKLYIGGKREISCCCAACPLT